MRDGGLIGAGLYALVYLDGRHIANIESNEVLVLHVPSGERQLGLQINDVGDPIVYEDVRIEGGRTYDFRISIEGNGWTARGKLQPLRRAD